MALNRGWILYLSDVRRETSTHFYSSGALVITSESPRVQANPSVVVSWVVICSGVIFLYFSICEIVFVANYTFPSKKDLKVYKENKNLELATRISNFVPIILLFVTLSWFIGIIWTFISTIDGSYFPREWTSCATFVIGQGKDLQDQ